MRRVDTDGGALNLDDGGLLMGPMTRGRDELPPLEPLDRQKKSVSPQLPMPMTRGGGDQLPPMPAPTTAQKSASSPPPPIPTLPTSSITNYQVTPQVSPAFVSEASVLMSLSPPQNQNSVSGNNTIVIGGGPSTVSLSTVNVSAGPSSKNLGGQFPSSSSSSSSLFSAPPPPPPPPPPPVLRPQMLSSAHVDEDDCEGNWDGTVVVRSDIESAGPDIELTTESDVPRAVVRKDVSASLSNYV